MWEDLDAPHERVVGMVVALVSWVGVGMMLLARFAPGMFTISEDAVLMIWFLLLFVAHCGTIYILDRYRIAAGVKLPERIRRAWHGLISRLMRTGPTIVLVPCLAFGWAVVDIICVGGLRGGAIASFMVVPLAVYAQFHTVGTLRSYFAVLRPNLYRRMRDKGTRLD